MIRKRDMLAAAGMVSSAIMHFLVKRFFLILLIISAVYFIPKSSTEEIRTRKGVDCVITRYFFSVTQSCNWDEYNLRTAYGCGATLTVDEDYNEFFKDEE